MAVGAKKREREGKIRTIRKLYDRDVDEEGLASSRSVIQLGPGAVLNNEDVYLDSGLQVLRVTGLHFMRRCEPDAEEMELFTLAGVDTLLETNRKFVGEGDCVNICKGNHSGKVGVVCKVEKDVVHITLEAGEEEGGGGLIIGTSLRDVRRIFGVGDSVSVEIGIWKGRRGAVLDVEGEELTIIDYGNKMQVRRKC